MSPAGPPTGAAPSDVAFSDSVKAVQTRLGSRKSYARLETGDGWETTISPELAGFIGEQTSFFLATASAAGQPYIQHRGGPKGFLRVLDDQTLAFADFRGNRQCVTLSPRPRPGHSGAASSVWVGTARRGLPFASSSSCSMAIC
jgi:predicted pyridoxine 5'-phosphate oxidase superfamily flavin-nucleotide-binding protein